MASVEFIRNHRHGNACRPWLQAELRIIRPKTVVRLGATATAAILGPKVRVLKDRGRVFSSAMAARFVTIHPSLLLRLTDRSEAKREYDLFVRDLRLAATGGEADDEEKRDNIHQADD